jgi:hypothetical protein
MPEYLAAIVGRKTMMSNCYKAAAAHWDMTVYLEDWEQAHAILGRRIAVLRRLRDDRRAAVAAHIDGSGATP